MKLLIVLSVVLAVLIGLASAKPSSSGSCSKQDEGKTYGLPEDCHQYVICKKGKLETEQCPSKYNYDTATDKCVKAKYATCAVKDTPLEPVETNEQYDYLCTKVLYGVRVHPEGCDKYLVCTKEKAEIQYCDDGFIFLASSISCVEGDKVSCTVKVIEPITTASPPKTSNDSDESGSSESDESSSKEGGKYDSLCDKKSSGNVAHPESCTKYISCTKNKAEEKDCKKGYSYSSKDKKCVKQKNGECADAPQTTTSTTTTTTTTSVPVPAGKYDYLCENVYFGNRAHPESCTKYISCSKNKAQEKDCKSGFYFSVYLRLCIPGNSETCSENNGGNHETQPPTEPTVEETTPTEPSVEETTPTEPSVEETTPTELVTLPQIGGDPGQPSNDCSVGFTGYLPMQNDCTTYVYCFQGEPLQRSCLENYIYYAPLTTCLPGDPVLCQLYSV